MNLGRIFANAIARRVAYLLVAAVIAFVLSLFGAGNARAQASCDSTYQGSQVCASRQEAQAMATALAQYICDDYTNETRECVGPNVQHFPPIGGSSGGYHALFVIRQLPSGNTSQPSAGTRYYESDGCPPSQTFREDLGRCFDPDECEARNGAENGFPDTRRVMPYSSRCLDGCDFRIMPETHEGCIRVDGGQLMCAGSYQFSGASCSAVPPQPNDPPPAPEPPPGDDGCVSAGPQSNIKVCKKPDGNECIESNSGAMVCWGVGETGQKADGAHAQTRGPGNQEPTPTPPTPPETFDPGKKTGPVTTETTKPNPNGSTTTTTTTVINNSTGSGTNAPGTPVRTPGGGGGSGGEGEDDEGSASGGGDCQSPPVTTGDPVMGMVAKQAWETRCAIEKIGKVKTTGDVGDCASPFTVEGPADDMNVQTLKALRAETCPSESAEAAAHDGSVDQSGIDGADSEAEQGTGFIVDGEALGADGLDTEGMGFSRSCPAMPTVEVFGTPIQFDNSVMCDWLELGGQLVVLLAALASLRIMAGVSI